jgi:hypothetical protein
MSSTNESPRVPSEVKAAMDAERSRRPRRKKAFLERLGLQLPVTEKDVKQAFYARVKQVHPDARGDTGQFMEVQQAFDEAMEFAKRSGKRLPWLGTLMPYYVAQRQVADTVRDLGGTVQIDELDWLEDTVGEDFAHLADRLTEIDLEGQDFGDEELEELLADPNGVEFLEVLRLADTQITDAGAMQLTRAKNLKHIDLRGTAVSASMQDRLAKLPGMVSVAGSSLWQRFWRWITGR